MINMSAQKPMFLDSRLFSSIFLGSVLASNHTLLMGAIYLRLLPWHYDDIQYQNDIYGLLTKREVKMAGYWPSSFFACLWTETKSRSINTQKKNDACIQPS